MIQCQGLGLQCIFDREWRSHHSIHNTQDIRELHEWPGCVPLFVLLSLASWLRSLHLFSALNPSSIFFPCDPCLSCLVLLGDSRPSQIRPTLNQSQLSHSRKLVVVLYSLNCQGVLLYIWYKTSAFGPILYLFSCSNTQNNTSICKNNAVFYINKSAAWKRALA